MLYQLTLHISLQLYLHTYSISFSTEREQGLHTPFPTQQCQERGPAVPWQGDPHVCHFLPQSWGELSAPWLTDHFFLFWFAKNGARYTRQYQGFPRFPTFGTTVLLHMCWGSVGLPPQTQLVLTWPRMRHSWGLGEKVLLKGQIAQQWGKKVWKTALWHWGLAGRAAPGAWVGIARAHTSGLNRTPTGCTKFSVLPLCSYTWSVWRQEH